MSRERNLVKNTMILAIGQLSSKIFTFLLLPVYTSMLSPDDFGTIDALQTIISLVMYFVTLQIENAIFRFVLENRTDKDSQLNYVTSGFVIMVLMVMVSTGIIVGVNYFLSIPYVKLIVLVIWSQSIYLLVSNLTRGLGENLIYSIASFLVTLSSLIINIVLIAGFRYGASSILIALIFSNIMGAIYLVFKLNLWRLIKIYSFNSTNVKEMLDYSLPLIPNAISWWIANTSDRLLIIYFLGTSFNGIYAAANKIPTIYTTIFTVFNTAWTESVALAINDSDRNEYINSMINSGFKLFSFLNMGIIICVSMFFKWLVGVDYVAAYNHIFILLVAIFVNSMCSLYGGVLSGLKNTRVIGWTTVVGAIINAIINFIFINSIGLYAASISTLISYIVIYIFRLINVRKEITIKIQKMYLVQCLAMLILVAVGYFSKIILLNIIILCVLIIWGTYHNKNILLPLWFKVKNKYNIFKE